MSWNEAAAPEDSMRLSLIALAAALVAATASHAAAQAGWTTLADCAAAYRANSQITDPDRPSSMAAMISDQAGDYEKAAIGVYRKQTKAAKAAARAAVEARIKSQTAAFSRRSRNEIDKFMDACPQPDQ